MKEISIKFEKNAYLEYQKLREYIIKQKKSKGKPTFLQLWKSLKQNLEKLKQNPHYGDLIPRKYIPKSTIKVYGTDKIFRIELVGYWRLLYTLEGEKIKIIVFVLEFMDPNNYNKKFKYRKK